MIAERMGFPAIIGELLVGIVLGPMALGVIKPTGELEFLANLGVMFMMFIMGLSINIEAVMKNNARSAASVTLIGSSLVFVSSAACTLLISVLMGQDVYYSLAQACIVGVALTSASTVIGFRYLSDIGDRFSNVFKTLVAIEVTDGIFSIVLLAVLLSIMGVYSGMVAGGAVDFNGLLPEIGVKAFNLFLLIIGFMILVIKFGGRVANWLLGVSRRSGEDQSIITLSLIILFAVAGLSDWLQLTSVIGAFLAGAILAGSPFSETVIAPKIKAVGYGLFIPIFFAYTGIQMNFGSVIGGPLVGVPGFGVPGYLILFVLLLACVITFKYLGTVAGCEYAGGFKKHEVRKIGCASIVIGEDTLVMAQVGSMIFFTAAQPLVTEQIFTVFGLLIIVTSVITPFLLKWAFSAGDRPVAPPVRRPRPSGHVGLNGPGHKSRKGL